MATTLLTASLAAAPRKARPQGAGRQDKGRPGGLPLGRDAIPPVSRSSSRVTSALPKTGWLTSERWGRTNGALRCSLSSQFQPVKPPVPQRKKAGEVAKPSGNLKCLFCSLQYSQFKFHAIFKLRTNMYYTILGLTFQRCFNL